MSSDVAAWSNNDARAPDAPAGSEGDRLTLLGTWIDDQRRTWNDRLDALEQHLPDEEAAR
ncbi:hypothetical protein [Micromonospora sp. LOL_024]|uniref:hypothetical protein n=1 Tax=Micromonospora sp. LOL_024 TaxID=3345412 RepID=UPI003A848741